MQSVTMNDQTGEVCPVLERDSSESTSGTGNTGTGTKPDTANGRPGTTTKRNEDKVCVCVCARACAPVYVSDCVFANLRVVFAPEVPGLCESVCRGSACLMCVCVCVPVCLTCSLLRPASPGTQSSQVLCWSQS